MKCLPIALPRFPGEPGLPGWPELLFIPTLPHEFFIFLAASGMALLAVAALYELTRVFKSKRRRS